MTDTAPHSKLTDNHADLGILICGHGSRAKIASEEFALLAKGLQHEFTNIPIEYGFLEYSAPNIHMALDALIEKGARHIVAVPGMLFPATHTQNDIPSVLTSYQEKHAELKIEYTHALDLQPPMTKAFEARILEALNLTEIPPTGELYDTLLLVVGRGTSVTTANAKVAQLTRTLCENLGFGWAQTCYSGITFPSVGVALEMCLKLGFKRILVAPYFLFGGRLINRIQAYVGKFARENKDVHILTSDYLRDQPSVIQAMKARIEEALNPKQAPLTPMEDFHQRLARNEVEVHHHHAEYQPNQIKPPHDHDTHHHSHIHPDNHSQAHSHTHSHKPYRHIGHPLGPITMINENLCCCFMSQFPQEILDAQRERPLLSGIPTCKR